MAKKSSAKRLQAMYTIFQSGFRSKGMEFDTPEAAMAALWEGRQGANRLEPGAFFKAVADDPDYRGLTLKEQYEKWQRYQVYAEAAGAGGESQTRKKLRTIFNDYGERSAPGEHLQIHPGNRRAFVDWWAAGHSYRDEHKYENNIGRPLTNDSRRELFEWKNSGRISELKTKSIADNYPLTFEGDHVQRYLNADEKGGAIWNIFYLHCLEPLKWPIYDQHVFRAMRYINTGGIEEIGTSDKLKYESLSE